MSRRPFVGVNLGGWLVLEDWMTRQLFEETGATDEIQFMASAGAADKITRHRDTFITEADFEWLQEHGVTHVRLPVGYWLFDAIDGCLPTEKYVNAAMGWAEKYELKVLLDLHVVRGGQNTFGYSNGRKAEWFDSPAHRGQAMDVLRRIGEKYGHHPALWGVELLNEPQPTLKHYLTLLRFYRHSHKTLRKLLRPGTHVVYHDAFQPLLWTGALWPRRSHPVVMDVHWYAQAARTGEPFDAYLRRASRIRRAMLRFFQLWQPVIVGEWSTVLPQRYFDELPQGEHMRLLGENAVMQQAAYAGAAGWIYWNYKVEGDGMWNFRSLVDERHLSVD